MRIIILSYILFFTLQASDLTKGNQAYIKQDYNEAVKLYKASCEKNRYVGCYNLALMYLDGIGILKNYAKAVELYTKACDGDVYNSCYNLGLLYSKGYGVKIDNKKASELYLKACDGNG